MTEGKPPVRGFINWVEDEGDTGAGWGKGHRDCSFARVHFEMLVRHQVGALSRHLDAQIWNSDE